MVTRALRDFAASFEFRPERRKPFRARRAAVACLLAAISFLAAGPAAAQDVVVEASVDRATVRENESFNYTIRAEGRAVGEPDVSFLEQQFDILNRTAATQIQLVNGRAEQVAEWTYQLMPKKAGDFTLPPLQFGNVLSNAVTVEVLPAQPAEEGAADIFMEVEIDPARVYVQAQTVYTLRLFVGVSTGRATLTAPPIEGGEAIVERLGEDRQYQAVRGGRNFIVRERRYAIFPQQAGPLTIGPVSFEAMVLPSRGFSRVQRLRSETIELEALAAVAPPPELAGAAWLPARELTLTERWADDRDAFTLGVPRTRTLTIEAVGLLETQLPEIDRVQAAGIRQYPDQPELEREIGGDGIKAQRIERYAVIAQSPGEVTIPAAELPWWNVREERWEVARVEQRTLPVLPGAQPQEMPPPAAPVPEPAAEVTTSPNYWPLVSAALCAAWLATLLLWLRSRARPASAPRRRARGVQPPSSRRLLKRLRAACAADDAAGTRDLLLEWAKLQFPAAPPGNLGSLRELLPEALAAEVAELEARLYGPRGEPWSGERLAALLEDLASVRPSAAEAGKDPLLPLYR